MVRSPVLGTSKRKQSVRGVPRVEVTVTRKVRPVTWAWALLSSATAIAKTATLTLVSAATLFMTLSFPLGEGCAWQAQGSCPTATWVPYTGVRRTGDLFYAGAALPGAEHSALRAMAVPKAVCRPET